MGICSLKIKRKMIYEVVIHMNYQWYPGHMTKARRMMQENIKLVDLVIELIDARIPSGSRNPDIEEIGKGKSRVLLLNKADLADEKWNQCWREFYTKKGYFVYLLDAREKNGMKNIQSLVQEACKEKMERDRRRGIINRPVRAMVVGIPNVGKSTFINSFAGKACAKTGNKPGVTKGKQWIRLNKSLELLDTPGILWPKFDDQQVGEHLAMIGAMNDEILHADELATALLHNMKDRYTDLIEMRYRITMDEDDYATLEKIAVARKCFQKGEMPDLGRASSLVLDDFRSGRLGRITLEYPEELS